MSDCIRLTRPQQSALAVAANAGDLDSRNLLLESMAGLVRSLAKRFMRINAVGYLDVDDLSQSGLVAIAAKLANYDPLRGDFRAWAVLVAKTGFRNLAAGRSVRRGVNGGEAVDSVACHRCGESPRDIYGEVGRVVHVARLILSPVEFDVIEAMLRGETVQNAADLLKLPRHTVYRSRRSAVEKLRVAFSDN